MSATNPIASVLGVSNFADYEQSIYEKYQEKAEAEIIENLNILLSYCAFLKVLKAWGAKCAYKYHGLRVVRIKLKSGRSWEVLSPVFLKAKPKKRRGRPPKRQKGGLRHLGLELLGIINKVSPALIELCVPMAVLCPSFEIASEALRNFGIKMNQNLLRNLTQRFANIAMNIRSECNLGGSWQKTGLRILICVDGGRFRERETKQGRPKNGQKRQGFHTDWVEPRLLTINQFDENGKKIKSIKPIIDGSCSPQFDDFFNLLRTYLEQINLEDAEEIVFSADGGPGIWSRIDNLIKDMGLRKAKRILDYTHAKQNMNQVINMVTENLNLVEKKVKKLANQIKEMLWKGNIQGITELVKNKLIGKKKVLKSVIKKLQSYFGDYTKFQYKNFRDNGLPTGSGTVESAIRRIINLRIKGPGIFWKRQQTEEIIFLRSLVITGKFKSACRKILGLTKKAFESETGTKLSMV